MGEGLEIFRPSRPFKIPFGNFMALKDFSGGGGKSPSTNMPYFFLTLKQKLIYNYIVKKN